MVVRMKNPGLGGSVASGRAQESSGQGVVGSGESASESNPRLLAETGRMLEGLGFGGETRMGCGSDEGEAGREIEHGGHDAEGEQEKGGEGWVGEPSESGMGEEEHEEDTLNSERAMRKAIMSAPHRRAVVPWRAPTEWRMLFATRWPARGPRVLGIGARDELDGLATPTFKRLLVMLCAEVRRSRRTPLRWNSAWAHQLGKPDSTKRGCEATRLAFSVEEIGKAFYVQLMNKLKRKPGQQWNSYAHQDGKAREGAILVQEVVAERLGGMGVSTVQQMFDEKNAFGDDIVGIGERGSERAGAWGWV